MGLFVKTLWTTVSVFALILASAVSGSAQTSVFINGDKTFTVTWSGSVGGGATLLSKATFTVSNWTNNSFVMTVSNVANTMPASPNINARLTAFGFGLTPEGTFSNQFPGSIYSWAFTNFPMFQRVDVCLTSGSGCAGGGNGGLNQGLSTPDIHSVTITGAFANGVTIIPIPAKFQTSLGSLETDGVVIDPPPAPPSDLTIAKTHTGTAVPGGTLAYNVSVTNVGSGSSIGAVTVTETPPTGLTVTALAGTGWTCTVATRTCTRSDALAPKASYPPITVTTSIAASVVPGTLTNTVAVSGGGESNTGNNTATDPTTITAPAPGTDLAITKKHTPQTVEPGQTLTYVISVSNVGGSPSSGEVTVTETPPAGLTVTALSGTGWTCTLATRICLRSDPLAAGASYPDISVTTSVGAAVVPGTVTNTAVVAGGGDSSTGNNTANDPTIITAPVDPPDLTIAKSHTPNIVNPGGTLTYTVTVSNVGPSPSSGTVTVIETPPAGVSITALSGTGWTCTGATCTRSDALDPGATYPPITVTASVGAGVASGTVTNTAAVSGGGDSSASNNTATDPTIIAAPTPGTDLAITKRHSPQTVVPGQTFTYTIAVLNVGGTASSGLVTVTETPPAGLTVTALDGVGWTCTLAALTCTRSDALAPVTSYPDITVTTSVGAGVAPGTVTNTAVVSGGGDTNTGNNTATDPTVINPPAPVGQPDLTLLKTPSAGSVSPGATITFTIRVRNVGNAPTSGSVPVTVTDTPPENLTVTALSGSGWTCVAATRTCLRADALAPGGTYPDITVTAVVAANAAGRVVNGAIVTGGGDTDPGNGTGTGPIEVDPPVAGSDLAVAKTRTGSGILVPGQSVTFTVRVTNVGASPTSGTVTVTETPPAGLAITEISGSGWTCSIAARTCTRAEALAPSASYPDISVTATIAADAAGTLVNSAAVSGGADSVPDNNTGSAPITIGPISVPVLPVSFVMGLIIALLTILALRARRLTSF